MDYSISSDAVCDGYCREAIDFDDNDWAVPEDVDAQFFSFEQGWKINLDNKIKLA